MNKILSYMKNRQKE